MLVHLVLCEQAHVHVSSCSTSCTAVHLALANKAGETYSEGAGGIQLSANRSEVSEEAERDPNVWGKGGNERRAKEGRDGGWAPLKKSHFLLKLMEILAAVASVSSCKARVCSIPVCLFELSPKESGSLLGTASVVLQSGLLGGPAECTHFV